MISQSPFNGSSFKVVALDASVILNLLATGMADRILNATNRQTVVVEHVVAELRYHPLDRRSLDKEIEHLANSGCLEISSLCSVGKEAFSRLVGGNLETTLDDGEAATLAHASVNSERRAAAIDEKKARRICRTQWPELPLLTSIDFFLNLEGKNGFDDDVIAEALYDALVHARMRVEPAHRRWVIDKIGADRSAGCSSLGVAARQLAL